METANEPRSESERKERLNNLVAVTLAVLAGFMAITKVKDDNICQAMVKEKSDAVDTWTEYQAKSIKQNLAELGRAQLAGLQHMATGAAVAPISDQVQRYDTEIARYKQEKEEIKARAQAHEKNYDTLNFRDDQFDLSDATLSIALGMLAVVALTGKHWLLVFAWVMGGFGCVMGIAGFIGLTFHPEWLVKFLS